MQCFLLSHMKERIKNLDPLRGFLALCVVIYHIPQLSKSVSLPYFDGAAFLHKGPQAVSVFFCLSGFLIIGLLYDEKKKFGKINIRNFYIRRILRLYPVYYLVLGIGFFYYHVVLSLFGVEYELNYSLIQGLALNILFLPNVFIALHEPGAILQILWSIGIEEQFYLFIAPLASLVPLKKYQKYLLVFTLVYFVLFHLQSFSFLKEYYLLYFFMSSGGLLAILSKEGNCLHFKSFFLRLLVYSLFVLYFITDLFVFENDFIQHVVDVILFNMLILNLANEDKFQIGNATLTYLGKISYGIYMYHMIAANFILFIFLEIQGHLEMNNNLLIVLINVLTITITILMAHVSYKHYESYFLGLKFNFRELITERRQKLDLKGGEAQTRM